VRLTLPSRAGRRFLGPSRESYRRHPSGCRITGPSGLGSPVHSTASHSTQHYRRHAGESGRNCTSSSSGKTAVHRPASVTRMVLIEPAARQSVRVPFSSFEFPSEEINVSRVLDSKPGSEMLHPGFTPVERWSSTAKLHTPGSRLTCRSRPRPSQITPALRAGRTVVNPAPCSGRFAAPVNSPPLSCPGPARLGDPLLNELNRFRGLVRLSK